MAETTRDLLVEEMQELCDPEKQLVKALPKMVKAASNEDLSEAFGSHLEQTKGQVEHLELAFEALDAKPKSNACVAMKGLIEKGVLADSAMICAAQKVEHLYEIAGCGTFKAWAEELGLDDVASLLLQETLDRANRTRLDKGR
jgi:ferritin-like metal-binding protein YciE